MSLVVPAVLPASREELDRQLAVLANIPSVRRIQIDVVDDHYTRPPSWPFNAIDEFAEMAQHHEMLPGLGTVEYEIDLMCLHAAERAGLWLDLGASRLTFHAESVTSVKHLVETVRAHYGGGLKSCCLASIGLAINVGSDLSLIEPYLDDIDYVQFMGIARIGRQGQPFDRRVIAKAETFHQKYPKNEFQIDGGVSISTARELIAAGASHLVVGSAILRAKDPAKAIAAIEALQSPYSARRGIVGA